MVGVPMRFLLALVLALAACSDDPTPRVEPDASPQDAGAPAEPSLDAARVSNLVRPAFCAEPRNDAVHEVFCADDAPHVGDLLTLETLLGFDPYARANGDFGLGYAGETSSPRYNMDAGATLNLNAVLLGLSTALSGHLVSPINPRAILIGADTLIAYQRGVQQVELATRDRDTSEFNFYLASFQQACNERGCSAGDLFTARVEQDWTRLALQNDEELKNTPLDCRQCHQRNRETPMLLMRELDGPWNHFFTHDRDDQPQQPYPEPMGRELVQDYRRAKGEESYAGLPIGVLRGTVGLALQGRVDRHQPVLFAGNTILNERWPWVDGGFVTEPARSATWDGTYDAFRRGESLAMPHYQTRPTDPQKQARLSALYTQYREGALAAEQLPDLSDIFPDDPTLRAEIGLQTAPGDPPATLLITACASCHNDVLDQTISRARFNVDLTRMDQAELAIAVERMLRGPKAEGVMPPPEARQLPADARDVLITYLRATTRSADDDARLRRAAELGMAVEPASDFDPAL
jgi:cytochrome c553